MSIFGLDIDIALIYFVYGLAFFSMGLAMALESSRSSLLANTGVLLPLALFGFIHGTHEWLEMMLFKAATFGIHFSPIVDWVRLGFLVISFSCLIVFGVRVLRTQSRLKINPHIVVIGLIVFYAITIIITIITHQGDTSHTLKHADAWARYLLAVPGAMIAAIGMYYQSQTLLSRNRKKLASSWKWAALGFAIYSCTQVIIAPLDIFPAYLINTVTFQTALGFPVQLIRAAMAFLITIMLIRAAQIVEQERRQQLQKAHLARVEALERVQQETLKREEMRLELLRHNVIAQEDERSRIARELHDQTAQTLTAFSLNLATLSTTIPETNGNHELVDQLQAQCHEISQGIYRIMYDLRPSQLDDLGLVPAMRQLADDQQENSGLNVEIIANGAPMRMDPIIETAVYRIAQEALTNVSRHAQTDRAVVVMEFDSDHFTLQIRDHGIGFDANEILSPPRGWGLASMRERSEAVGGKFRLVTSRGTGTTIEVRIPLDQKPIPNPAHSTQITGEIGE
jgi:signal transduction histidine kinase